MRLLLDTHIFIWWDSNPAQLSSQIKALCEDTDNNLILSVASVWEMQIKQQFGKLSLRLPLAELIQSQRDHNGLEILGVSLEHVLFLENLPSYHKDPFDRLLIAQARVENTKLVSADPVFKQYSVDLLS
jgi:PIN domain nuclease of toxin-antitoxin system